MPGTRKSLARRTFAVVFALSLVVMVAATIAATAASFTAYERDAEQLLLSQCTSCASTLSTDSDTETMCTDLAQLPLVDTRCTLVAADGTVLYDSAADPSQMGNHADRTEIAEARATGQGTVMRRSETLGTDTLYAAALVRDGIVVRLAETRTSLASFLGSMAGQLAASLVIIFLLSLLLSRLLTRMVVRPLHEIDLAQPLDNDAYEELQPLLKRVDTQRRELEGRNDELAHAVTLRREFTGNVSHEMKSPLQVISGYAELMENNLVPADDVPRLAGLIRSESETMRGLIDDVLVLSRLDEGADAAGDPVELAEVCRRVADRLAPAVAEREETIRLDLDNDAIVTGSPAHAEQMAYNLFDNAIKYNREGGTVQIALKRENGQAILTVADEGCGIPADARERVFERFYRVDASRSRETGGTGLGLAIVKHAAEAMGGTVTADNAPSGGALFTVALPLR